MSLGLDVNSTGTLSVAKIMTEKLSNRETSTPTVSVFHQGFFKAESANLKTLIRTFCIFAGGLLIRLELL